LLYHEKSASALLLAAFIPGAGYSYWPFSAVSSYLLAMGFSDFNYSKLDPREQLRVSVNTTFRGDDMAKQ